MAIVTAEHMGREGRLKGGAGPWEAVVGALGAMVQGWEASLDAWNNWEGSSLLRAAQMEGRDCEKVPRKEASDICHLQQSNFAAPIFLPFGLGRNLLLSMPKSRAACTFPR